MKTSITCVRPRQAGRRLWQVRGKQWRGEGAGSRFTLLGAGSRRLRGKVLVCSLKHLVSTRWWL